MIIKQPLAAVLRFKPYGLKRGVSGMMSLLVTWTEPRIVMDFCAESSLGPLKPAEYHGDLQRCRGTIRD